MSRPKGSKNLKTIQRQAGLMDFELTRQSNIRSFLWYFNPNENEALDYATRRAFLSEVKYMVRNQPIINRILSLVENHAVGDGLSVTFNTGDVDFDTLANATLDNYWNNAFCLVNQYNTGYDVQKLLARYLMIYGEFFILLTESQSGYPQFQIIEPENVCSPDDEDIEGRLIDGCYVDSNYKILAYSVKTGEDKWTKVDAANLIHCKDARSGNSLRGVSPLSSACVSSRHLRDLIGLEIASAKSQSAFAYVVTKHGGSANGQGMFGPPSARSAPIRGGSAVTQVNGQPTNNALTGQPIVPIPPATQILNGGAATYLDIGETVVPLTNQRSSAGFQAMVEYLEQDICYAAGLDYYFVTKANSVTTGEVRFSITDAQQWFRQFQNKLIYGAFQRLNLYVVSKLINNGILPKPKGNIFNISFGRPAILTIDRQRENTIDQSLIANGLMSDTEYYDKHGLALIDVYNQRIRDWTLKNKLRADAGLPPLPFVDLVELELPKAA